MGFHDYFQDAVNLLYGNFDIILDHFSLVSSLSCHKRRVMCSTI